MRRAIILIVAGLICVSPILAEQPTGGMPATKSKDKASELRTAMRELWADHVVWTRDYIIAAVSGTPDADVAVKRLMKNQEDIGDAMKPYYGADAAKGITELFKQHISIAGELVAAAKAGDDAKTKDADKRWHDNAEAIATYLSTANPYWSKADLQKMMNEHLALTKDEAVFRLQMKWDEDVANYDKIYDQAMMMADDLTDGIVKQFPDKFGMPSEASRKK
jgi:hypothetical protein